MEKIKSIFVNNLVLMVIGIEFFCIFLYAIVRYNFAQDVGFDRILFFVINKAIAYSALFAICVAVIMSNLKAINIHLDENIIRKKKDFGLIGFYLAIVHVIVSLRHLNQINYPKLFDESGNFSFYGTSALIAGIIAFIFLSTLKIVSIDEVKIKLTPNFTNKTMKLVYVVLFFVLVHNFFIGSKSWLHIEKWAWYMPPITLMSAISIVIVFWIKIKSIFFNKNQNK